MWTNAIVQCCKFCPSFRKVLSFTLAVLLFWNCNLSLLYLTTTESIGEKSWKSKLLCIEYHLHAIIFCILLHVCNLLSRTALSITFMQSYFVACLQPFIPNWINWQDDCILCLSACARLCLVDCPTRQSLSLFIGSLALCL